MMEDSIETARNMISAVHGQEPEEDAVKTPSTAAAPLFVEVNSQVRQRLGLQQWKPSLSVGRDLTTWPSRCRLRVRSRSSEDFNRDVGRQRPNMLSDVWSSDTDDPPLRRKLRPPSSTVDVGNGSSKRKSKRSCVRTWLTAVVLNLMTFVAALTIHALLSYDGRPTIMSSGDGDDVFCDPNLTFNVQSLGVALRTKVYGQDLALNTLLRRLSDHFNWNSSGELSTDQDVEPTVLVLHGGVGTGKTHTAHILSDHFTRAGMKVHWYISAFDRPSKNLLDWVASRWTASSSCSVVFVLDDFDVILDATQLEAAGSYWKSKTFPGGATRPIFVVTFSKESKFMETELLEHLMNNGSREDFVSDVVQWQCPLGDQQVTYVPFLPIQSEQLEDCVRDALGRPEDDSEAEETVAWVVENTNFVPERYPVFSKSGCKRLQLI